MPRSNDERRVEDLKERLDVLTGHVRESDLCMVRLYAAGDPEEYISVVPAVTGRYKVLRESQWPEIDAIMASHGMGPFPGHSHKYRRLLTPEQMAERDKNEVPDIDETASPDELLDPSIR